MQTSIAPARLEADPRLAVSEKILRTCVHCGFCTATCPTYLLLGDELDSPRGRIYLIKDMLEGDKPATPEVVTHIDRCLSCLSCMTTCPSGVHYMHLVDHAREHIEKTYARPLPDRLLRDALAKILPYPKRFRAAMQAAKLGKPASALARLVPGFGERLAAMLELAPATLPPASDAQPGRVFPADGARLGRVALLTGCAQSVLDPGINDAAIRLLTRHGVEVVLTRGEGCCGALTHHLGKEEQAHAFAKANIAAWTREAAGEGLDAILVTTSGCGTVVKDYGFMLREDVAWAERAASVSALAKDVSEYLATLTLRRVGAHDLAVTYHAACSLQHGQGVREQPKALLRAMGFAVKEAPEAHICCGSAGTYNLMQPELAGQLRARKTGHILKTRPQVVATGNIGCMTQIAKGFADRGERVPVVHLVELLDWATGGPEPKAIEGHA